MFDVHVLPMSLVSSLLLIAASILSYTIFLYVDRIYLHPLSGFPGPRLAACTYWYELYHDLVAGPFPGQGVYNIDRLHKRYGPIVRVSPEELSIKDADWFDVLYKSGRRSKWAKNSKANGSPGSVASAVDHQLHKARRAPLTPFFSKRGVTILESTIRAKVDQMTEGIERQYLQTGKAFEVGVAFTALTLDVISDYCFGQSWRCLSAPEFAPEWKRTMTNLFEPVPIAKQFPVILQIMAAIPQWALEKMNPDMAMFQGAKDDVQKQVERIIAEYEDNTTGVSKSSIGGLLTARQGEDEENVPRTIFQAVLESSLPASEKTVDRITDEAFVMVVAGGETTAKTLTNALYYLLANPAWRERVLEEVNRIMPDPNVLPSSTELEQLPNLTAAIKETLRVSAPVTNRVQVLDDANDLNYREWIIPKGTPIAMSVPAIHLDGAIFRDPYNFDPARFLGEEGKLSNKYYMPFHRGYRNCLGMNLAYTEIYLGLAAMLRRFDLELFDTVRQRDVDVVRDCFIGLPSPQSKGVRIKVLRRRN